MSNEDSVRSLLREQSGKLGLTERQEATLKAAGKTLGWDEVEEAIIDAVNEPSGSASQQGKGTQSLSHILANVERERKLRR